MSDDLIERLKGHSETMERDKGKFVRFIDVATCTEAADRIEALEAENERLRGAIKVQASAVRALQANEATEINILRQQKRDWHHAVSTLDSEREANAILTAENERLREALQGVTPPPHFGESEQNKAWWAKARAALETKP